MIYTDRLTTSNNWSPFIRYPSYEPERRLSHLWFLALAIIALSFSVLALIIVFAVEHSWFYDNFNNSTTRYGLWRLCFNQTRECDSWFAANGPYGNTIEQRLSQNRGGIHGWQALEIVFLFLTTSALIIALATLICYRYRRNFHYYLSILATLCAWLAATIGISSLFVFGFAVFNVASSPRDLDWCFYVNLVAVILALLAAILLSIYDAIVKKPVRTIEDDTVVDTYPDLGFYSAPLSPSTFVIVRSNKKNGRMQYSHPRMLYPSSYYPPMTPNVPVANVATNPKHDSLAPYTSITTTQDTTTLTQPSQKESQAQRSSYPLTEPLRAHLTTSPSVTSLGPPLSVTTPMQNYRTSVTTPYVYETNLLPQTWYRTGPNPVNVSHIYDSEPPIDYNQDDFYPPPRTVYVDRRYEPKQEPRVLRYYTGYDYFATVDQANNPIEKNYSLMARPGSALRYGGNTSYSTSNDYIKTTM